MPTTLPGKSNAEPAKLTGPKQVRQRFDGYVLKATDRLIARGIYPSAKHVATVAGTSEDTAWRVIRRLRREGRFPTNLPQRTSPRQEQLKRTARRVTQAYHNIIKDGRMPTTRRIVELLDVSYRTVQRHIRRLEAAGQLAEVPFHIYQAYHAPINRFRDRDMYKAVLKVHSIDCEKHAPNNRMSYQSIAKMVSQMIGRPISDDQVGRYLNATGYWRRPWLSKPGP